MRHTAAALTLLLFALYAAMFPGSTITVALNQVPSWGVWMGSALLILQGLIMLSWLGVCYGWRGLLAGGLISMLGLMIENLGVTTGLPFGAYYYTSVLQPQILGRVPLAIGAAWLMIIPCAAELGIRIARHWQIRWHVALSATLVVLRDLQIEPVATRASSYWVWLEPGPYYGVPLINFAAWWLVGAGLIWGQLRVRGDRPQPLPGRTLQHLPPVMVLMSVTMFTTINLARGYWLAGGVGLLMLLVAALTLRHQAARIR